MSVRFVVGHGDVECVEEFGELVGVVAAECVSEIGDRGEHRGDLVRVGASGSLGLELSKILLDCGALLGEGLEPLLRGGDDGMVGIVVFFETK